MSLKVEKKKLCVGARSSHYAVDNNAFLSGRPRTRLKNASEIWNLDLNLDLDLDLDLDLAEVWISIASNKM